MNRVAAALAILLLLAGFALFGHCAVLRTTDTLTGQLLELKQQLNAGEYAAARRGCHSLLAQWEQSEALLTLFLKRDMTNALAVALNGLDVYLDDEHRCDALRELERALAQTAVLRRQYFDPA